MATVKPNCFSSDFTDGLGGPCDGVPQTDTVVSLLGARSRSGRALADLIEAEIIPRLLQEHSQDLAAGRGVITSAEVTAFAKLLLDGRDEQQVARIEQLLQGQISFEALLIDLFTPVARELGQYWEDDLCNFVDVTVALCRLQQVMREAANRQARRTCKVDVERSALFSAMPGDQHGFGAVVIEEMFARAGWSTERLIEPSLASLSERLSTAFFDMVGLTVSCDVPVDTLPPAIAQLRQASYNSRLIIMVGGPVFVRTPELADEIGADGTASNALTAVLIARDLVDGAARQEEAGRHTGDRAEHHQSSERPRLRRHA